MSFGEALKRTKEGSDGDGGRKEPTSTSRASAGGGGGELVMISGGIRASTADPFRNCLLSRSGDGCFLWVILREEGGGGFDDDEKMMVRLCITEAEEAAAMVD